MKTINPFLPTSGYPQTVPSQLTRAGGTLYLVNQSNANYTIDFQNGNTATLLAQHARAYKLRFPLDAFMVTVQSVVLAAPVTNPQIWGEAFDAGEDTGPLFSGPLTNDITQLGQPLVRAMQNVNNTTFTFATAAGTLLYLMEFCITMDKAAVNASNGQLQISLLSTSVVGGGSLYYYLVQSTTNQNTFKRKFAAPIPSLDSRGITFAFPNLNAGIALDAVVFSQ